MPPSPSKTSANQYIAAPIAYLGPKGTFSHLVAERRFRGTKALLPCDTIGTVFQVLAENPAARAVVPIENSSGGTIYDTVDLLIEQAGAIKVIDSIALDVRLALIGRKGKPIRAVYSHFVPLQHRKQWLHDHLPDVETIAVASTAVAAEMAAKKSSAAALASPSTAALFGLDVLQCPVGERTANVTHFLVLAHAPNLGKAAERLRTAVAVAFENRCGALYHFLGPFARHGINMNRLISRPIAGCPDACMFFMELDGAPGDAKFEKALARAKAGSKIFLDFGSYSCSKRYRS